MIHKKQPRADANSGDFDPATDTASVRAAKNHAARNLKQITIEYFGHRVVEGKHGKEVVDVFDKRHPNNKKNTAGGSTIAHPPTPREMMIRKLMDIHGMHYASQIDIEF